MRKLLRIITITFLISILFICYGCTSDSSLTTYQVNFDLDGGTTSNQINQEVEKNTIIELFTPVKTGYTFKGWRESDDLIKSSTFKVVNNTTLKAVYQANDYQVNLDLNGGVLYSNLVIDVVFDKNVMLPTPTKPGSTFKGWFHNDEIITSGLWQIPFDITLKAKWETKTYQITFNPNGGVLTNEILNVNYHDTITLPVPTKVGYDFLGWYLDNQIFTDQIWIKDTNIELTAKWQPIIYHLTIDTDNVTTGVYVKDYTYQQAIVLDSPQKVGYQFTGWTILDEPFNATSYEFTNDVTIKATWKALEFTITFNANGGKVSPQQINVAFNMEYTLPIPQKEGFKFIGWYKANNELYESGVYQELDNLNLIANWQKNAATYTLKATFTANLFNQQTDSYEELSLYEKGVSITASKYWHKIGIVKAKDDKYYVSGIASSGTALSQVGEYDYVLLAYSNYALYSQFVGSNIEIGNLVEFNNNPLTFNKGTIDEIIKFYDVQAGPIDPNEINDYLGSLYDNITIVNQNISLVSSFQTYIIKWQTSNKDVISNSGIYHKPVVTRNVILTAFVSDQAVYTFTVKVVGEKETSNALATGYFYTNFSSVTDHTIEALDIIYCSFVYTNESADFTNTSSTSTFMKNITSYILPKAKKYDTKVLFSVNESNGSFSSVCKTPELRLKLANNIVTLINQYGFDGVDIDWEFPDADEVEYFTLLMKQINEKVKANNPNHLVTAAIGGGKWQPPRYDLNNSTEYLDFINLMLYSMVSSNGYHQSPLYKSSKGYSLTSCSVEESIAIFDTYNVPHEKLLIGIPFYGIRQYGSSGLGTSSTSSASYSYNSIYTNYLVTPNENVIVGYDEECEVPYIYDKTNQILISYDNEKSIARKCEYVNTLGLGGVMYWQDGHDHLDDLLDAVYENIRK